MQTDVTPLRSLPVQTENPTQVVETQTVPDTNNREVQTEQTVDPCPPPTSAAPLIQLPLDPNNAFDSPLLPPQLESINAVPVESGQYDMPNSDCNSITKLDSQPPQLRTAVTSAEVQTDPVTIIIGDASFLIEKLKGSKVKREKRKNEFDMDEDEEERPRVRSGYIPGSGLRVNSTPMPGRIPLERLKSTPVIPFNPKVIDYRDLANTSAVVKRDQEPILQRMDRLASSNHTDVAAQPEVAVEQEEEATTVSCPYCESKFSESASLYDHIATAHDEKRKADHRQPKGRSGAAATTSTQVQQPEAEPAVATEALPEEYALQEDTSSRFTPSAIDDESDDMPDFVRESVEYYRKLAIKQGKPIPGSRNRAQNRRRSSPRTPANTKLRTPAMPVLGPAYSTQEDDSQVGGQEFRPSLTNRTYKRAAPPRIDAEPPSLFEDLPTPRRSHPRARARRGEAVKEYEEEQVDDSFEYECPHCPARFERAPLLYSHLKNDHQDEMQQQQQSDTQVETAAVEPGASLPVVETKQEDEGKETEAEAVVDAAAGDAPQLQPETSAAAAPELQPFDLELNPDNEEQAEKVAPAEVQEEPQAEAPALEEVEPVEAVPAEGQVLGPFASDEGSEGEERESGEDAQTSGKRKRRSVAASGEQARKKTRSEASTSASEDESRRRTRRR